MLAASLVHYAEVSDRYQSSNISMLLVHDIGETDTGDTMVFVEGGWEERKTAELAAVRRIFGMLPEHQPAAF